MPNTHFQWSFSEKYADYVAAREVDQKRLYWSDPSIGVPLPPLEDWKELTLRQYLGEGPKLRKAARIGDAPNSGPLRLIGTRAADALRDIWERHALLYPVILEDAPGETYFMVVCKTQLGWDSLDDTATVYGRSASSGEIYAVRKWAFLPDKVGENELFVLPHSQTSYFVSQRFVDCVIAARLKGFCFRSVHLDPRPLIT